MRESHHDFVIECHIAALRVPQSGANVGWSAGHGVPRYLREHIMRLDKHGNPWFDLDANTLSDDTKAAYDTYKTLYHQMKEARECFETLCTAEQPDAPMGKRYAFTYNYGKLSVGVVPDDDKPKASKSPKVSLAQFLAAQAASGRAA